MTNRTAVVTGASSGIGLATAEQFLTLGWRVIGIGRDPGRCAEAEARLRATGGQVDFLRGDFCEMADVARIAREIAGITDRVDCLVNNAGGVRDARYVSSEGIEATMAANHFAPFLLTRELLPLLRAAASAEPAGSVRVLAVSSLAHEHCPQVRWDDLMWDNGFVAGGIYCQAKLCNMLFTRELDRRLAPEGIVAQAMHPGLVYSNFSSHGDEVMQKHFAASQSGNSPDHAAQTLVWMATAAETGLPGGRYFHDCQEVPSAPQARDDAAAQRLWQESERVLAGLGF